MRANKTQRIVMGVISVCVLSAISMGGCSLGPSENEAMRGQDATLLAYPEYPELLSDGTYEIADDIEFLDAESPIIVSLHTFGIKSMVELFGDSNKVNTCYSPVSLFYALSMVAQGSEHQTREQLFDVLEMPDDSSYLNQYRSLFLDLYTNTWADTKLSNSIWISRNDSSYVVSFLESMKTNFFGEVYAVDFGTSGANESLNAWVRGATGDVVNPDIQSDDGWKIVLMNALSFKATWAYPFDESQSFEGDFRAENHEPLRVTYMTRNDSDKPIEYRQGACYTSVELPFEDGSTLCIVLPHESYAVKDLLADPAILTEAFYGEYNETAGIVYTIPQFSFDDSYQLADCVKDMGASLVLSEEADLSGMVEDEAYVSEIKQDTHIMIDEEGAQGGAYTMVTAVGTSLPPQEDAPQILDFNVNRPFIYAVHSSSGVPLLYGYVTDPTCELSYE